MPKKLRKVLKAIFILFGVGAVSYLLLLSFIFGKPALDDYSSRREFDSAIWKNSENSSDGVRLTMVDDLLKSHRLTGLTKENVNQLLGIPPQTQYFKDYDYVYWLGPERGVISIDSEWLVIKFRENLVIDYKVVRD